MQAEHVKNFRCEGKLDREFAPSQSIQGPALNLLRLVIATVNDGVVVKGADGAIVLCNAAAEQILGMRDEQLCGLTLMDERWASVRTDGTPCPWEEHPAAVALRTGVLIPSTVMDVHVGGGERRRLLMNARPLLRPGKTTPYGVVASFTDITALHRQEAARRRARLQTARFFTLAFDPVCVLPSDAGLVALVHHRPGISLREVCAAVWPDLTWGGGTGTDSATGPMRTWQIPPCRRTGGNRAQTATAAAWLLDRLQDLVTIGALSAAPRRRDEVDVLASVAFLPGPATTSLSKETRASC